MYKFDIKEYNIFVVVDERLENYEIFDLEYVFWIIFLNIFNNFVYWLKKFEILGEIRLYLENENFIISNLGFFINEEFIGKIFEYGVIIRFEKNVIGLGFVFI